MIFNKMSTQYIIKNKYEWWLYANIMECKIILKWGAKYKTVARYYGKTT